MYILTSFQVTWLLLAWGHTLGVSDIEFAIYPQALPHNYGLIVLRIQTSHLCIKKVFDSSIQ